MVTKKLIYRKGHDRICKSSVTIVPEYILDSSFLISLAKIKLLLLIKQLPGTALCPEEVYQEVVETGLNRGYTDAFLIAKEIFLPEPPQVKNVIVKNRLRTPGISPVDDSVLSLGVERKAVLLTDDIRLRKKAFGIGLETHNTPEFLMYYLGYEDFASALDGLVKYRRLDVKNAKIYLEVKRKWKKK